MYFPYNMKKLKSGKEHSVYLFFKRQTTSPSPKPSNFKKSLTIFDFLKFWKGASTHSQEIQEYLYLK